MHLSLGDMKCKLKIKKVLEMLLIKGMVLHDLVQVVEKSYSWMIFPVMH